LIPSRNAAANVRRIIAIAISFFANLPLNKKHTQENLQRPYSSSP
jgi:hypothetical protein